ncbi:MAG: PaaI family thioesterase [Pseudomonadota bacterium]
MDSLTKIAEAQPYARLLGVKIIEASAERVVGELLVRNDLCTSTGTLHGGVMMGFCDILGATGAWFALPDGANGTTTVESNTSMMSSPKDGTLITGISTPIKIGRRLSIWQTEVTDPDGRKVCLVRQTQLVL